MAKKRLWLTALIVCVSLFSVVLFWLTLHQAMSSRKSSTHSVENEQGSSDEFEKMTIKIPGAEKNGYWELHVNKGESLEDGGHLNQINGTYIINKKPFYRISGKNGIIYWKTRVLKVNGNVMLKTADGNKVLTADELLWDPVKKNVAARRKVVLRTTQVTVTADEMVSNLILDQVAFTGPTRVVYKRVDHD